MIKTLRTESVLTDATSPQNAGTADAQPWRGRGPVGTNVPLEAGPAL